MKILEIWVPSSEIEIYKEFGDWVPMKIITLTRLGVPEAIGKEAVGSAEMTHAVCYNEEVGKIEEYPLRNAYLKKITDESEGINDFGVPSGTEGEN